MTQYHPRTEPFPHQAEATIKAITHRNWAFFFEPRCGKSKAALDAVGMLALAGYVKRVAIICPAIATDVWEHQLKLHYPFNYRGETFDDYWKVTRQLAVDIPRPAQRTEFWICSREELFRRERWTQRRGRGERFNPRNPKHNLYFYHRPKEVELEAWDPDLIILDESHEYSKAGAVASQDAWHMVRRLRKRRGVARKGDKPMPWVYLCTGTPKGYRALFSQFRIMDEVWGTSAADFDEAHAIKGVGRQKWTVVKWVGEKKLLKDIEKHSSTITAAQAGLAGKLYFEKITYKLPPKALKMYLEMVTEFITEWEGGFIDAKNAGVKRVRLLQILGGFTTEGEQIHRAGLEKLEAYAKLLLGQDESLVVYSRYTPEVAAVHEVLQRVGFEAYRVDGTVSKRDRREAIQSLATRPAKPTAISFQHQAGSRAIELVGAAETFYYSLPDGFVTWQQTLARTGGTNQTRPRRATLLVCPGSVHPSIIRALARQEDWHQTVMKDPARALRGL